MVREGKLTFCDSLSGRSRVSLYEVVSFEESLPSADAELIEIFGQDLHEKPLKTSLEKDGTFSKETLKRKRKESKNSLPESLTENTKLISPPKFLFVQEDAPKCDIEPSIVDFIMLLLSLDTNPEPLTIDFIKLQISNSQKSDKSEILIGLNDVLTYLEKDNKILLDGDNIYLI